MAIRQCAICGRVMVAVVENEKKRETVLEYFFDCECVCDCSVVYPVN